MKTTKQQRRDSRGFVAVVRATARGPAVSFPYGATKADALRSALAVWGEHDGEGLTYPCTFFVQERGQWVGA